MYILVFTLYFSCLVLKTTVWNSTLKLCLWKHCVSFAQMAHHVSGIHGFYQMQTENIWKEYICISWSVFHNCDNIPVESNIKKRIVLCDSFWSICPWYHTYVVPTNMLTCPYLYHTIYSWELGDRKYWFNILKRSNGVIKRQRW